MVQRLTEKQKKVFLFLKKFQKENGYLPSLREIGLEFGINHASANQHIQAMIKKGYIKRLNNRAFVFLKDERGRSK